MKERFFSFIILIVLASVAASYFPPQDYMKKVLSRNPRPLGLKESKALNKLLEQSSLKWVIRSEIRHILN